MKYNFDEIIERRDSHCVKYDAAVDIFGTDDIIPMWVADMDFKTPDFVLDAIAQRLQHPILGYFYHHEDFYQSIISWMEKRHQWSIQKEWINFSPGLVTGLATIVQAFTEKGDKVIVQPPVYHPFYYVIENQERILVRNPLVLQDEQYRMDFEDLEKKLQDGVKMLILCNPHNPVGRCWSREELKMLGDLCLQYHCLILSDEIHSDLIMPGFKHTPLASISEAIAEQTITCMAPSKTFNLAGLSSSEVIISNPLLRKKFEEYNTDRLHLSMGNLFGDVALTAAYRQGEDWLTQLLSYLAGNVKFAQEFFAQHLPQVKTYRHEATYLLWVNFNGLALSHEQLNRLLIKDAKVGFNTGTIFGESGKGFMRINLACPKSVVEKALSQVLRAIQSI